MTKLWLIYGFIVFTTFALSTPITLEEIPHLRIDPPPLVIEHKKVVEEPTPPEEACNCYRFVYNRTPNLPRMADIWPNAEPQVGAVAVEWFGKVKHVSIVTKVEPSGVWVKESNYNHCEISERFIPFGHYSLHGFWVDGGIL